MRTNNYNYILHREVLAYRRSLRERLQLKRQPVQTAAPNLFTVGVVLLLAVIMTTGSTLI